MLLLARDRFGNPHTKGGFKLQVSFKLANLTLFSDTSPKDDTGTAESDGVSEDQNNGQYLIHWKPSALGLHCVLVNGKLPFIGSTVNVTESADRLKQFNELRLFYKSWQKNREDRLKQDLTYLKECDIEDLQVIRKIGEGAGGCLFEVKVRKSDRLNSSTHGRKLALKKQWDYGITSEKVSLRPVLLSIHQPIQITHSC